MGVDFIQNFMLNSRINFIWNAEVNRNKTRMKFCILRYFNKYVFTADTTDFTYFKFNIVKILYQKS